MDTATVAVASHRATGARWDALSMAADSRVLFCRPFVVFVTLGVGEFVGGFVGDFVGAALCTGAAEVGASVGAELFVCTKLSGEAVGDEVGCGVAALGTSTRSGTLASSASSSLKASAKDASSISTSYWLPDWPEAAAISLAKIALASDRSVTLCFTASTASRAVRLN